MQRRQFLIATSSLAGLTLGGCLGNNPENTDSPSVVPLDGHLQFGYDAGNSNHAAGLTGPREAPSIQQTYPSVDHAPLTTEDALYFATASYRFDGDRRWGSQKRSRAGTLRPAIVESRIVGAGADAETFVGIEMETGDDVWQTELSGQPVRETRVADDRAFYATFRGAGCVDLDEQEEAWHQYLTSSSPFEREGHWRSPAVTGDHVVMTNSFGPREGDGPPLVYGLDRETGEIDWTTELEGDPWGHNAPIADDRYVYVTPNVNDPVDHEGGHPRTQLTAIDPETGDVAWRRSVEGHNHAHPAVAVGTLYFVYGHLEPDEPALLSAFDTADGSIDWTSNTWTNEVRIVVTDETVYVGDTLHCRGFDRSGGDSLWELDLLEAAEAAEIEVGHDRHGPFLPVVQNGRLFTHIGNESAVGLW